MRPTVGIICEYDPFHLGHARQFALVHEQLPDARIVCVMSGCFTQRGSPALFAPAFRAHAALAAGASMVLELPCAFALREAENFALGGVAVLDGLSFVTHISFGCENADVALLRAAAALLEAPTMAYQAALRKALDRGAPFVAAQAEAVAAGLAQGDAAHLSEAAPVGTGAEAPAASPIKAAQTFAGATPAPEPHSKKAQTFAGAATPPAPSVTGAHSHADAAAQRPVLSQAEIMQTLKQPNNILAICYLRALSRLQSNLVPLPVKREGDYHAAHLTGQGYPSASATRRACLAGDIAAAEAAAGYPLAGKPFHRPDALDTLLLHTLRSQTPESLRALPDCTEGLENRLAKTAREAASRAALLDLLKTRRYARARLNRLLGHALLGITGELLSQNPLPTYARLLGFRADERESLSLLNDSRLPIMTKAADGDRANPLFALDARAYDLWALGAGLPAGLMYRQPVQIV